MIKKTPDELKQLLLPELDKENIKLWDSLFLDIYGIMSDSEDEFDESDFIESYFDALYDICEHENYEVVDEEDFPINAYSEPHSYIFVRCEHCGETGHFKGEDIIWD